MSPRKKEPLSSVTETADTAKDAATSLHENTHLQKLQKIPSPVRFVIAVLYSLALSSAFFTLTARVTLGELGSVSKHLEAWWEVGGLMAWKAIEVGLAWVLGFDGRDVTSFIFLTHLPTYILLSSFYNLRPTTLLLAYAITVLSTTIPFALLRTPSPVHTPSSQTRNSAVLQDTATTIYTALAATSLFTVTLYASYSSFLPAHLVVHFDNLPSIAAAHAGPARLPVLFATLIPAGLAARDFLFVSSVGASSSSSSAAAAADKPRQGDSGGQDGEYLAYAVYRKTWGALSTKARVLAARTAVLAVLLVVNTVVQVAGTVQGVSVEGAAGWGLVWAGAAVVVGLTYGWIEGVEGM